MSAFTSEQLAEILAKHRAWLLGQAEGARANLSGANLSGAYLSRVNLSGANLYGTDLSRADLSRANVSGADLSGANLSGANLYGADLSRADLSRANLSRADLYEANLSRADLSRANLSGAKMFDGWQIDSYRDLLWIGPLGSRNDFLIVNLPTLRLKAGCFEGTIDAFLAAVERSHGKTEFGREYVATAAYLRALGRRTQGGDVVTTEATRTRGAEAGHFEVRATNAEAWLSSLEKDVDLDAVSDGIVYIAITSGPATLEQVESKWSAGGNREAPTFKSLYVTASYLARGQICVLSAYCGVVWALPEGAPAFAQEKSVATGAKVTETWHRVEVALAKHRDLQVRYGSSLALHNVAEPWQAHPQQSIEVPPEMTCATCGGAIYFANNAFRHKDTGRAEVNVTRAGRTGNTILALHHLADPSEKGKQI